MDTERSVVSAAALTELAAACRAVREADPSADLVAGVTPAFVASPASTEEASALLRTAAGYGLTVVRNSAEASSVLAGEATNAGVTPATRSAEGSASRTAGQAAASAVMAAADTTLRSVSML